MKRNNTAARYYLYFLFYSIFMLVFFGLLCSVLLLPLNKAAEGSELVVLAVFLMLVAVGYFGYALIQYLTYRNAKFIHIQRVKLDKVETLWRDLHGFVIVVEIDGEWKSVSTKHVFGSALFAANHLDQYSGRIVEVGYIEKKDEWVVLTEID